MIGVWRPARLFAAAAAWLVTPLAMANPAASAGPVLPVVAEQALAGQVVQIDVYQPPGPVRGAVVLSHGFTRSRSTLGAHAAALAQQGFLALTPDLPSTFNFQRNAQGLAELVALLRAGGTFGPPVPRTVLVGFSAGGLSSLLAAATPGVVGYVGLDPFDRALSSAEQAAAGEGRATGLGLNFAPGLRTPALLLRAPPSRCNAQAVAAPWAQALPALLADRVIANASHCDFEAPSDWLCQLACGAPDPARQAQVRQALLDAVGGWLPPEPVNPANPPASPKVP